ncbi:MAG TPA: CPBP family intramembrane glutamic endopeptidase, partial [Chitinophagaceae bacterium]|nr:CPBP family intramembrane glutamic endopeptidase [Chitinophagaceae bacterium]
QKVLAMTKAMLLPENVFYLQLSQVLGVALMMFLPALSYMLICHGPDSLWLGFSRRVNIGQILLGACIIFCANLVSGPAADLSKYVIDHLFHAARWAQSLEDDYNQIVAAMSGLKGTGGLLVAIIIMAFLPAMFEEMIFRGAIQNLLVRWWKMPVLAIVFTSLFFSFIHGSAYLFLSRAILGFALGWMYYRSKNIWVNIFAHFSNNALAVIQLFYMAHSTAKPDLSKLDDRMPMWIELVSIAVFYGLFILFDRVSAKNRAKIETDEQKLWIKSTPQYNNIADKQN